MPKCWKSEAAVEALRIFLLRRARFFSLSLRERVGVREDQISTCCE
jgi:hypothetical protein